MCVILHAASTRPTQTMMRRANDANPDGIGVSWTSGGRVHWRKGLTLDDAIALVARIPMPFIVHFRWASIGKVTPGLCHPFPIGGDLALKGTTRGAVLAHNGTWSAWAQRVTQACLDNDLEMPDGDWSDTRGMAWLVKAVGPTVLREIGDHQRLAVVTAGGVHRQGHWSKVVDGLFATNLYWLTRAAGSALCTGVDVEPPAPKPAPRPRAKAPAAPRLPFGRKATAWAS
jgi:hypothetical protein